VNLRAMIPVRTGIASVTADQNSPKRKLKWRTVLYASFAIHTLRAKFKSGE